jgi:hypothetical protein
LQVKRSDPIRQPVLQGSYTAVLLPIWYSLRLAAEDCVLYRLQSHHLFSPGCTGGYTNLPDLKSCSLETLLIAVAYNGNKDIGKLV